MQSLPSTKYFVQKLAISGKGGISNIDTYFTLFAILNCKGKNTDSKVYRYTGDDIAGRLKTRGHERNDNKSTVASTI